MRRPWTDLHPKILAAFLALLGVIVLAWLSNTLLGTNLGDQLAEWFAGAVLPLVVGYLKTGD